jgi:hypothetical protein
MKKFSPQVIVFLADAITGGPSTPDNQSPWPYRAGWKIARFFKECGYSFTLGQSSRVPWTEERLEEINKKEGIIGIAKIVNRLIDPRDWINNPLLLKKLVIELNKLLFYDGYEIIFKKDEKKYLLRERGSISPIVSEIAKKSFFQIESIKKDFDRALASVETDPADSITSSCSFVESICKHILDKLGKPYPKEQTINSLVKEVMRNLSLLPQDKIEEDLKRFLGSLGNIAQCVGNLRTKLGDAHGHTINPSSVEPIYAKVAIGAASTLALFLVEKFEGKISSTITEDREDKINLDEETDIKDIPF